MPVERASNSRPCRPGGAPGGARRSCTRAPLVMSAIVRGTASDSGAWPLLGALTARRAPLAALRARGLILAGCGGGTPQDARNAGNVRAREPSFRSGRRSRKRTDADQVRNVGTQTAPNVAVTVNSFGYRTDFPESPTAKSPTWVDRTGTGPGRPPAGPDAGSQRGRWRRHRVREHVGARTARDRRATRTFCWQVVPVKPGLQVVRYVVAAGLAGQGKRRSGLGRPREGCVPGPYRACTARHTRRPEHRPGRPRARPDDLTSGRRAERLWTPVEIGPLSKDRPPAFASR